MQRIGHQHRHQLSVDLARLTLSEGQLANPALGIRDRAVPVPADAKVDRQLRRRLKIVQPVEADLLLPDIARAATPSAELALSWYPSMNAANPSGMPAMSRVKLKLPRGRLLGPRCPPGCYGIVRRT